jgi:hypothetical protein
MRAIAEWTFSDGSSLTMIWILASAQIIGGSCFTDLTTVSGAGGNRR